VSRAPLLFVLGVAPALVACPSQPSGSGQEGNTQPSPNASILPVPLASAADLSANKSDAGHGGIPADSAGRLILPEAGPPEPTPLREDTALPRDTLTQRDGNGVTLEAQFKWPDLPAPAAVPEASADAIKKAREKTLLKISADLAPAGRMRFVFASPAFPVPKNAELRGALEHYGFVLVWPDGNAYRVLRSGTLRALFAERRADALPLMSVKPVSRGKGSYLGLDTVKTSIKTSVGELTLEEGNVPNIGHSGDLLCRLLIELVAADPTSAVCNDGLTPVRAEYHWAHGGRLQFEVSAIMRRQDLPFGLLFVPPAGADFKPGELPPQAAGVLLTKNELASFRTKPVNGEAPAKDAPGEGLVAENRTDSLRYVLIDGVPAAWLLPHSEQFLIGPLPGRYSVSWRDFLGANVDPGRVVTFPARARVGGESDAGTPPG
jgi:hypothetical protein